MKRLAVIGLATITLLSFGALLRGDNVLAETPLPNTATPPQPQCSDVFSRMEGFELITSRTGGFSPTTQENLVGPSMFLTSHFESFDGTGNVELGPNPRPMLIFRTASGRFVVRFLDWPGAI